MIAKIAAGQFPRGVAISSITNVAVVANANSNDVTVIDLNARVVLYTVKTDVGPTGVAIHELTNEALITNSGIIRGSTDFGVQAKVSVLDIAGQTINRTIAAGSAAFGIAINQDSQEAVVANFGSNDVTVIRIPNPIPHVTGISPKSFPAGGGAFTVTVTGTGFIPASVVTLNGQSMPTTFISATQLKADVPAALLQQVLQVQQSAASKTADASVSAVVTSQEFDINVTNPGPGGGPGQNSQGNQLTPQNMPPVLLSISPTQVNAGSASLTLSLSGNNFNGTSIINFGSLQQSPLTSNGTSMTVSIPAGSLATAGPVAVTVTNPGAGTTTAQTFTINPQGNAAPSITSVNPPSVPAASGPVTVTVQGTGFTASTTATLGSVTGIVSGNTTTFNLSAADTQNPAILNGLISNAGGSASFSVNVLNVAPTVSGFTPAAADAGSAAVTLTVNGTNFNSTSQITLQGTPVPTQFVSSTRLTGTIPDTFLRRSGNVAIGVTNTPPGGGSANGGTFTISSPVPVLGGINPSGTPVAGRASGYNGSIDRYGLHRQLACERRCNAVDDGFQFIGIADRDNTGSAPRTVGDFVHHGDESRPWWRDIGCGVLRCAEPASGSDERDSESTAGGSNQRRLNAGGTKLRKELDSSSGHADTDTVVDNANANPGRVALTVTAGHADRHGHQSGTGRRDIQWRLHHHYAAAADDHERHTQSRRRGANDSSDGNANSEPARRFC